MEFPRRGEQKLKYNLEWPEPGRRADKSINSPPIILARILSGMGGRVRLGLLCLRLHFGRLAPSSDKSEAELCLRLRSAGRLANEESESELSALLLEGSGEDGWGRRRLRLRARFRSDSILRRCFLGRRVFFERAKLWRDSLEEVVSVSLVVLAWRCSLLSVPPRELYTPAGVGGYV